MDKDSQDVHQELAKLKAKIQEAREQISNMPGIESSPAEQQQQLATLREQVRTKNQLLQKYKSLCMFDVPKASWSWRQDFCCDWGKEDFLCACWFPRPWSTYMWDSRTQDGRLNRWTRTYFPQLYRSARWFLYARQHPLFLLEHCFAMNGNFIVKYLY